MPGIEKELSVFLQACLAGNFLCMIYGAVRMFRRLVKHSLFWISMEDLFFWVFVGIYLFAEMYRTCSGEIRWYFVAGVFLGTFLTIWVAQKGKKGIDILLKRE